MGISLDEQAVQVEWKAAQITAKALKELIQQLLENRNKITHGEQKLTKLNLQGKKLESVENTSLLKIRKALVFLPTMKSVIHTVKPSMMILKPQQSMM